MQELGTAERLALAGLFLVAAVAIGILSENWRARFHEDWKQGRAKKKKGQRRRARREERKLVREERMRAHEEQKRRDNEDSES